MTWLVLPTALLALPPAARLLQDGQQGPPDWNPARGTGCARINAERMKGGNEFDSWEGGFYFETFVDGWDPAKHITINERDELADNHRNLLSHFVADVLANHVCYSHRHLLANNIANVYSHQLANIHANFLGYNQHYFHSNINSNKLANDNGYFYAKHITINEHDELAANHRNLFSHFVADLLANILANILGYN